MRLQEKAKQVGFEWEHKEQVWEKVEEEIAELKKEVDPGRIEEEFGDVLFSMVNYARFLSIDAENALERTNKKFIQRFSQMEETALNEGRDLHKMSLGEMDEIWNRIKQHRDQ